MRFETFQTLREAAENEMREYIRSWVTHSAPGVMTLAQCRDMEAMLVAQVNNHMRAIYDVAAHEENVPSEGSS